MNLINQIDEYLTRKNDRERTSYYPSEVSKCTRQLYYKWTKCQISNEIEAGGYWKMEMGAKIHDLISNFLEDAGLEIAPEISFQKDVGLNYPISGRIDNLFIDEDDKLAGIEVKTSYGAGIKRLQSAAQPRSEDLMQVIMYMGCNPEIDRFYLLYIGRDNAYRTQFVVDKNTNTPWTFDELLNRFKELEDCVLTMRIPQREFEVVFKDNEIKSKYQKNNVTYKSDWQCMYCQYRDYCWEDHKIRP